ncbi:MAG: PrgI family protein, partial [bacterium]
MQFKVPQFLDVEDKIFGPFTFSQFVYLVGGAGLCFILFKLLGFLLGAIPILLVGGFSAALTFYRPNNKPLVNMIESGFKYLMQDKLYIWKRRKFKKSADLAKKEKNETKSFSLILERA